MAKRLKMSGDGSDPGDWTQRGNGLDYPDETDKYRVLRPLHHDGVQYPIDSVVELTDDQAEDLLLHQVIKLATVEVPLT